MYIFFFVVVGQNAGNVGTNTRGKKMHIRCISRVLEWENILLILKYIKMLMIVRNAPAETDRVISDFR